MRKLILAAAVGLTLTPAAATAANGRTPSLSGQVAQLKVAAEHHAGYNRDLFGDYDRPAILAANFAAFPSCDGYYSRYDGKCWKDASDVDIDHTVALGEAWDSGAWAWTTAQRDAFAADTRHTGNLQVMTDNLNASKGDDDPAEWLPPRTSQTCQFVGVVVRVKLGYRLSVDAAEKAKLAALATRCDGKPTPKPTPKPTRTKTPTPTPTSPSPSSSTAPGEAPAPTPVRSNLPVTG